MMVPERQIRTNLGIFRFVQVLTRMQGPVLTMT